MAAERKTETDRETEAQTHSISASFSHPCLKTTKTI